MPTEETKSTTGTAPDDAYFNNFGYAIEFYHVPSGNSVAFKAFLKGFSDGYTSNWDADPVYGRNDPIGTFQNTQRKISLSWVVPSVSIEDARLNLEKCSLLARMTYPAYAKFETKSNALGLSKAPLMKLKLANLIHDGNSDAISSDSKSSGLLGWVDGFTFAPDLELGFLDSPETQGAMLYPKAIMVSCNFTVNHQHSLGWSDKSWIGGSSFPYGVQPGSQAGVVPSRTFDGTSDSSLPAEDIEADNNSALASTG